MNQPVHRLADLRWGLWKGNLDWTPLHVRATATDSWRDVRITVHILGTSHAFSLGTGCDALHELVTCAAPPQGSVAHLDQPGEATVLVGGYEWITRLRIGGLDETPSGGRRLEETFSTETGARTVVAWTVDDEMVRIWSYHGYPEVGMALLGESRVRRRQ